jgi:hypothetical protein
MYTVEDIDLMYFVGGLSGVSNVEMFSATVGGRPQVVYVYPGAREDEVVAAKSLAEKLGIPIVMG